MFIRIKQNPNSPKRAVQIVESTRDGNKVRQRIVRHVGTALDDDELEHLKNLAEHIKATMEDSRQPTLFVPEKMAEFAIESRKKKEEVSEDIKLKDLKEEQRIITGFHEIYGEVYRQLNFSDCLGRPSICSNAEDKLFHIVMARIANPGSKKSSVRDLSENFGIELPLRSVYRMMDYLDDKAVVRIKERARLGAEGLLKDKIRIIFYDCTTLYFESFKEDELKENGYSKDLKFNQPQVLLALLVTLEGLPLGYEVFPGSTFEGNTLETIISQIEENYKVEELFFVADCAMMSEKNMQLLNSLGKKYIVGCKIKNQSKEIISQVLDKQSYLSYKLDNDVDKIKEIKLSESQRIIVTYDSKRAQKDAEDRTKNIEKLRKKLSKNKSAAGLISNYGYKKFLKFEGNSRIILDEKKINEAKLWDGLHGVITNNSTLSPEDVVAQYHGLWQIEECFRISKHDLKVRPIYHWTPERIRAHIAICFIALVCVRHMMLRAKLQYRSLSSLEINKALTTAQLSILKHKNTGKLYGLPSNASPDAVKMYAIMGKKYFSTPFDISI